MEKYDHRHIEKKWQTYWAKENLYKTDLDGALNPFYNLMMFPYPSAEGLHIGGMYTFTGIDSFGRYKRMKGYDVFEPMGLDAFGIHSENYALKIGEHIKTVSQRTEKHFYEQLHMMGNMYDWDHKLETNKEDYYKWTQWLFVQLFKAGLAYRKEAIVKFCPSCKTVLSDEQVIDGKCERCGTEVIEKDLQQWFFRITKYADRLYENLKKINWDSDVKLGQKNWINKKVGINIHYSVDGLDETVSCFTTHPDTNFGATFVVIAPEYEFVKKILEKKIKVDDDTFNAIKKYVEATKTKSYMDRVAEGKEKTGVFTGYYAINQLTNYKMPIWISDFVLAEFGTGAVVGVPAHDERDYTFALKFKIASKKVVDFNNEQHIVVDKKAVDGDFVNRVLAMSVYFKEFDSFYGIVAPKEKAEKAIAIVKESLLNDKVFAYMDGTNQGVIAKDGIRPDDSAYEWGYKFCYTGPGEMINSEFLNGVPTTEANDKIMDYMCEKGWGERVMNFNLRDWCVSRQRYWGPPIPMIYCENCTSEHKSWFTENKMQKNDPDNVMSGWFPDDNLPVRLPEIESFEAIKPDGSGRGPLASQPDFVNVKCPNCGAEARRETDVSDPFVDSCWFFLRYPFTDFDEVPFGGDFDNSKSFYKSNISKVRKEQSINRMKKWGPVNSYVGGKEHTVLHLLYARFITMALHDLGYLDFEEPFNTFYGHGLITKDGAKMSKSKGNVINPDEFIEKYGADAVRLYLRFIGPFDQAGDWRDTGMEGMYRFVKKLWKIFSEDISNTGFKPESVKEDESMLHRSIKEIGEDMETFRFNTAVALLMEFVNWYQDNKEHFSYAFKMKCLDILARLLAPMAPHIADEFWGMLGHNKSIHLEKWPEFDEKKTISANVKIAVQVNGKLRGVVELEKGSSEENITTLAMQLPNIPKYLGNGIKRTVYVADKVINFITP